MMVSKALGWRCEEPQHSFALNKIIRRGWPGLANFFRKRVLAHHRHLRHAVTLTLDFWLLRDKLPANRKSFIS